MEEDAEEDCRPEIDLGEYSCDLLLREGKCGTGSHLRRLDAFRRVLQDPVVFDAEVEEGAEPFKPFRKRARRTRPGVSEIEGVLPSEVPDVGKVPAAGMVLEERPQEPVLRDGALVEIPGFAVGEERVERVLDGDDLRRFLFAFAVLDLADDPLRFIERAGLQGLAIGVGIGRGRRPRGTAAFLADRAAAPLALLFVAAVDGEHDTPLTQCLYKIVYISMRRIITY